jgi:hypothetical protein
MPALCLTPCGTTESMARSDVEINAAYIGDAVFISSGIYAHEKVVQPGVRPFAVNTAAAAGVVRKRMTARAASGTLVSVEAAAADTE